MVQTDCPTQTLLNSTWNKKQNREGSGGIEGVKMSRGKRERPTVHN